MDGLPSETFWRVVSASVRGTSHMETGTPCQDSCFDEWFEGADGQILIMAVSDGAGSASQSGKGAAIACEAFAETMIGYIIIHGLDKENVQDAGRECLSEARRRLAETAVSDGLALRDYACTLLGAVLMPKASVFFQVGDGAIVISYLDSPDEYCHIFWPGKGRYANTTFFVTDEDAQERLETAFITEPITEVALFTDGIEALALDFASQSAFNPFFKGMFQTLRNTPDDQVEILSKSLTDFLDSERVNARTDDDKTLIMASCVYPNENHPISDKPLTSL